MPKKIELQRGRIVPLSAAIQVPIISCGGAGDEVSITATSFPGVKVIPSGGASIDHPMLVIIQYVVECRVTGGHQLKARLTRSNPGPYPCLNSEVVLTTQAKYENRYHSGAFELPAGENELCLELCVSGGTGYIRYRFFSVILSNNQ